MLSCGIALVYILGLATTWRALALIGKLNIYVIFRQSLDHLLRWLYHS